jgi:hypothetical protein
MPWPAIGLTQPDYGDKQIAAIAREVPRESRDVTDDRVVRGQCQKHHPATVVGKAAQLDLGTLCPGVRMAGDTEKLGFGVDLRYDGHQRRAVRRLRLSDQDRPVHRRVRLFRKLQAMLRNRDNSSKGLRRILSPLGRYLDHHPVLHHPPPELA